ncbi:MAG: M50 family metallopeptidase, partial [Planctomycetota bacterium]
MKNTQAIKQGLLLFGSFNIAYNLAYLFHEVSHGFVAIITGGTFSDMVINPFSWSYSYSSSPNQLVHISAGALGAILVAGVIYLVFYWKANPWLFPLLLIAPIAMLENGTYYIVDIIMNSRGDACRLVGMGVHSVILIFFGVICVVSGIILAVLLIRKMGLFLFDFKGRLFVLGIGVFPSALAMLIWNWVYNQNELLLWTVYTVTTIVLTLIVAVIPKRIWKSNAHEPQQLKWKTVVTINLFYIGLLVFWFVGPFSANNVLGVETFSERPKDFPVVMDAPDFATDITYFRLPNLTRPYSLSYDIPESIPRDQIRDYITNIHNQCGYILLT